MTRFLISASFFKGMLLACFCAFALYGYAQVSNTADNVSTPVEGVGHDYIHTLSETTNPANGSVSIRIETPVSKSRGITVPFGFSYNSNSVHHIVGSVPTQGYASWQSNTGYLSQGGWSYQFPMVSAANWEETDGTYPSTYSCDTWSDYMFMDAQGGSHALDLATQQSYGSGQCTHSGLSSGGGNDEQVAASLPNFYPDPYYNPGATTPFPVTVYTPNGTVYTFPESNFVHESPTSDVRYFLPTTIEDRNGNLITVKDNNNGNFVVTDTAGRTEISSSGFGPSGGSNTLTISGLTYQVFWTTVSATFSVPSTWVGNFPGASSSGPNGATDGCSGFPSASDSQTVVSKIVLPNGQEYQFHYGMDNSDSSFQNHYGLLNEIDYPSGAWVKYAWAANDENELLDYPGAMQEPCGSDPNGYCTAPVMDGCLYRYANPVVSTREVGTGGSSSPSLTQTFIYTTSWGATGTSAGTAWTQKTTTVVTTDNVTGKSATTIYTYSPLTISNNDPLDYSAFPPQVPVETTIQYYNYDSSPLRQVNKTWYDRVRLKSDQTVLENGQTSETDYSYASFLEVNEKDEYDYGQGGRGALLRKTLTNYQSITTPVGGIIADAPQSVKVQDGNGNLAAETDFTYDATPTQSVSAVQQDGAKFPAGSGIPRGNVATKTQRCFSSTGNCTNNSITQYTYDQAGQVTSVIAPCGYSSGLCGDVTGGNFTTDYAYTDSYTSGGTPPGNTDTYLTQITDALGHTSSYSYDYGSGELTASKDPNGNSTTYQYSDPLERPTQVSYPDGGQTTISYNDDPPNPTVTVSKLIDNRVTPNIVKTTVTVEDGLGQSIQTQLTTDPDGEDYTDLTYDGLRQVVKKSNPHRSSSLPTDGITTTVYDALGRVCATVPPDGGTPPTSCPASAVPGEVVTVYQGNCSTVTDEAGKSRKSCSDALGRLTNVWEDPAGLDYETDYTYNALDDLTGVVQKGGDSNSADWRVRSFTYDSLSRLLSATNPESGTIGYSYDLDGNLISRIAPAPNQPQGSTATVTTTYTYDVLNRLTGKSYSDGTSAVQYGYDGAALRCADGFNPGGPEFSQNTVGRMNAMCNGLSSRMTGYDLMGRVSWDDRSVGNLGWMTLSTRSWSAENSWRSTILITTPSIRSRILSCGGTTMARIIWTRLERSTTIIWKADISHLTAN